MSASNSNSKNSTNDLNKMTDEIYNMISHQEVDSNNIMNLLIQSMQFTERYPKLEGKTKKEIVINAITQLVNKVDNPILTEFVKLILPAVIDAIIAGTKNLLELNEKYCKFTCCK